MGGSGLIHAARLPPSADVLPEVPKGQLLPAQTYVLAHHPHLYKSLADIDANHWERFWGKHAFELGPEGNRDMALTAEVVSSAARDQ